MPPRKASDSASSEPARRSTRIASLPKVETVEKPARTPSSKKRPAAEEAKEGKSSASKKAKPDEAEEGGATADEAESSDPTLAPINIVAELAAEKGVVIFLVPKADTPGCTTQACGFRDIYPDFSAVNYTVYCLSADSPTAQGKWQTKKNLPYPLISDPKRTLITALGASEGGKTKRSHFIFEKGGKLIEKQLPVKPANSPTLALEFIKDLSS
ncbi:thioredoxin-like protein [Cyathus striatus]|nr:thioredoxin-like protein [Cyathus striatus]